MIIIDFIEEKQHVNVKNSSRGSTCSLVYMNIIRSERL